MDSWGLITAVRKIEAATEGIRGIVQKLLASEPAEEG